MRTHLHTLQWRFKILRAFVCKRQLEDKWYQRYHKGHAERLHWKLSNGTQFIFIPLRMGEKSTTSSSLLSGKRLMFLSLEHARFFCLFYKEIFSIVRNMSASTSSKQFIVTICTINTICSNFNVTGPFNSSWRLAPYYRETKKASFHNKLHQWSQSYFFLDLKGIRTRFLLKTSNSDWHGVIIVARKHNLGI